LNRNSKQLVGVIYSYASHCFRREYGKTPEQYLLEVRLDASKVLLRETNLPIIDVIRRVGAKDDIHLRKAFRKQYSCSMTDDRNNHRGNANKDSHERQLQNESVVDFGWQPK